DALLVLYLTRTLGLGAAAYGLLYTIGSLSGIAGAIVAGRVGRRFDPGQIAIASALLLAVGWLLVPLVSGPATSTVPLMALGALLFGLGNTTYNINSVSLYQRVTPAPLLGRVGAALTFVGQGVLPLGALLGGILGQALGLRPTLLLAGS